MVVRVFGTMRNLLGDSGFVAAAASEGDITKYYLSG
jgi:hypothetical protein